MLRMDPPNLRRNVMQHYGCESLSITTPVPQEEEDPACCSSSVCQSLRAFVADWRGQTAVERLLSKLK